MKDNDCSYRFNNKNSKIKIVLNVKRTNQVLAMFPFVASCREA